ncbi:MAG: hypothetical protein H7839_00790 [Magnetococcus sp. YQC-5]
MHAITFDTLEFTEQLKNSGVPDEQAKGHAKALATALKQTAGRIDELFDKRDKQTEERLDGLATKQDLEMTKTELKRDITDLEYRMTIKFGLMFIAGFGMLFTALRYFPPTQPIVISNHSMPTHEQNAFKAPAFSPGLEQNSGKKGAQDTRNSQNQVP